jgi:hypothetical protein
MQAIIHLLYFIRILSNGIDKMWHYRQTAQSSSSRTFHSNPKHQRWGWVLTWRPGWRVGLECAPPLRPPQFENFESTLLTHALNHASMCVTRIGLMTESGRRGGT